MIPNYKWIKSENWCQDQKLTAECNFSSCDTTQQVHMKRYKQNSLSMFTKMIIK